MAPRLGLPTRVAQSARRCGPSARRSHSLVRCGGGPPQTPHTDSALCVASVLGTRRDHGSQPALGATVDKRTGFRDAPHLSPPRFPMLQAKARVIPEAAALGEVATTPPTTAGAAGAVTEAAMRSSRRRRRSPRARCTRNSSQRKRSSHRTAVAAAVVEAAAAAAAWSVRAPLCRQRSSRRPWARPRRRTQPPSARVRALSRFSQAPLLHPRV